MTFHGYFQKSTPDAPVLRLVIGSPVPSPRIPDLDANIRAFDSMPKWMTR